MHNINELQSGPCIVCGARNYRLSCGGPSICPSCDCGTIYSSTDVQKLINENWLLKLKLALAMKRLNELLPQKLTTKHKTRAEKEMAKRHEALKHKH